MIPTAQLRAFSDELQKTGASPWVHGATALGGAGLAGYAVTPHMLREHERDLRDYHMGVMGQDVLSLRDRRRRRQALGAVGAGAVVGGLSPFAVEALGGALRDRLRAGRNTATETARDIGESAVHGAADAFSERADDIAGAAGRVSRGAAENFADVAEERIRDRSPEIKEFAGEVAEEAARKARKGAFGRKPKPPQDPGLLDEPSFFGRLFGR